MKEEFRIKSVFPRKQKNKYYVDFEYCGMIYQISTGISIDKSKDIAYKAAYTKINQFINKKENSYFATIRPAMNLEEAIEYYIKKREIDLQADSIYSIKKHLKYFMEFVGNKYLIEITKHNYVEFNNMMIQKQLSSKTRNDRYSSIKTFFYHMKHDEIIDENPFENANFFVASVNIEQKTKVIPSEKLPILLTEIQNINEKYKIMILLGLFMGLRTEEIIGLKKENYLFPGSYYVGTKKSTKDTEIKTRLKSKAAYRHVILYPEFSKYHEIINNYISISSARFPFENSSRTYFIERCHEISKKIGTVFSPHILRHTFASLLIAMGKNPLEIKTVMGHTDIRTTFNTYGHLMTPHYYQKIGEVSKVTNNFEY